MSGPNTTRVAARRLVIVGYAATAVLVAIALLQVLRSGTDPANTSAPGYLPLAYAATAILVAVFVIGMFVRSVDITLGRHFPWLVGLVSLVVSLVPWWAVYWGRRR